MPVTLRETVNETIGDMEEVVLCPNCKTQLRGQFCASCGQNQRGTDRFLFALIAEAFEDVFTFDSRASKTIFRLLFKPGALTREYFRGRRARYVQPLRLYFITSLAFFFLLSVSSALDETEVLIDFNNTEGVEQSGEITSGEITSNEEEEKEEELTEEEISDIKEGLTEFSSDLTLGFLSEERLAQLEKKFELQLEKAILMSRNNPNDILDEVLDLAPPVIFVLLPLFAILLKIVYFNSGRYYTEHLILAVHNHCFIYISLLISGLIGYLPENTLTEMLKSLVILWIPIYLFLSLKNTYEEGWFFSTVKYIILGASYTVMFGFVSLIALVLGVLNL